MLVKRISMDVCTLAQSCTHIAIGRHVEQFVSCRLSCERAEVQRRELLTALGYVVSHRLADVVYS